MQGMTLDELLEAIDSFKLPDMRDRFALAALSGLLASEQTFASPADVATAAYGIADAMMAEMGDGRAAPADPVAP